MHANPVFASLTWELSKISPICLYDFALLVVTAAPDSFIGTTLANVATATTLQNSEMAAAP